MLGFLDPGLLGTGFSELVFGATLGDQDIINESFTDAEDALTYFDDHWIEIANVSTSDLTGTDLHISFALTTASEGDGVSTSFLVAAVPEPGTGGLLLIGMILLSVRRRCER